MGVVKIASGASRPRNDEGKGFSSNDSFKPYYVAHTKIQTLALLDDRYKGSNWSRWWRWRDTGFVLGDRGLAPTQFRNREKSGRFIFQIFRDVETKSGRFLPVAFYI